MSLETILSEYLNERVYISYGNPDTGYDPCVDIKQGTIQLTKNGYRIKRFCTSRTYQPLDITRIVRIRHSTGKRTIYKHPQYHQDQFTTSKNRFEYDLLRNGVLEETFLTKAALNAHICNYGKQIVTADSLAKKV